MTSYRWTRVVLVVALTSMVVNAQSDNNSQKDRESKSDPTAIEEERLDRLIQRTYFPETEREKVLEEIGELAGSTPLGDDPDRWFEHLATDGKVWDRNDAGRRSVTEVFDRIATRMKITGTKISRSDFRAYARAFLETDRSPPWREGRETDWNREAERVYRRLDRNGDGGLAADETPRELLSDLSRWDADGDKAISRAEYASYFPDRFRRASRAAARPRAADQRRGAADPRGGPGLPAWFDLLDLDQDGQVGLYEWRRIWPAREFVLVDHNEDGFLTTEELRRILSATGEDRIPLADDLAKRQIRPSSERDRD